MFAGALYLFVELVVLFFGVSLAIELLQRRIGLERLRAWMGGRPVVCALKGIAIGFMTPFCTFTAIPMLVGMRQASVPTAGYVAFIVAAPVLDPILFAALAIIVGLKVAIIYLAVAFSAAMGLALFADKVGIDQHLKPVTAFASALPSGTPAPGSTSLLEPSSGLDSPDCGGRDDIPWRGMPVEIRHSALAAIRVLRSVAPVLMVGLAVGIGIETIVPADTAADITGSSSRWSIPIAAGLGIPLYFSTSLFVPIADSLSAAGVGIGTIVALTIAGAGANVPEFIILGRLAKPRLIATFFGYVFGVAVGGGVLAQALAG